MKSRYLINILLIALVFSLYWFVNQEAPKQLQGQGLTATTHGDITKITILRDGLDTISIQKNASNWRLVHPINAPANNTRIKLLLSILNTNSHAQLSHADNATQTQLGFNDSSTILKLNEDNFQFGNIESISKRRYVLHNDVIHLIDDNVAPLLNANAASFIDNKLIALNHQISKLSLPTLNTDQTLSTHTITIEQKEGHWKSDNNKLSSDQLTILIDAWQHAYALQVLPLSTASVPASEPHNIVVWFQNQTEPVELQLQQDNRTLYLNSPSQQLSYQFPIALLQQLLPISP
ncbi:MAG: hypothetical protein COA83_04105 [Methylophaga sp.]|nr:MAG: hypothetical protein COA83_04105 [Methylophaga sp.]